MPALHQHNGASLDAPALSLDALDATALSGLSPTQLAALAQRCAAILSAISIAQFQHAIMPLHTNGKDAMPARMLSADEAALILHKPRRWLFTNARRYAWIKRLSRKSLLVDEAAMLRWIASRP